MLPRNGKHVARATALIIWSAGLAGCGGSSTGDEGSNLPAPETFAQARDCFQREGFRTLGGPSSKGDTDAPAFELNVSKEKTGAMATLAIYDDADEARRLLPGVQKNVEASKANGASISLESRGSVTVVWIPSPPADELRSVVDDCLP